MTKPKKKFIASAFLGFGITFLALMGYGLLVVTYVILPQSANDETSFFVDFSIIFMLGVMPSLIWIFLIHRGFTVVEIDEIGVEQSLFRVFHKKAIRWDELKELRFFPRVDAWLFISKIDLSGMTYDQIVRNKNVIQMTYSEQVVNAIREYSDMELLGLAKQNKN